MRSTTAQPGSRASASRATISGASSSAGPSKTRPPRPTASRRWTTSSPQYQASETDRIEAMDNLSAWLPGNIPPETGTAVVHGDFRLDNAIFHPAEPKILAVLDWELSTLGDPLADFAYHCMSWHIPPGDFR